VNRLLLVGGDGERTERLTRALRREGFAVKVAPEAMYALTMLERERPPLLLVDGAGGDLPAAELAAIVRSDPALVGVTLMVALHGAEAAPDGFDLVVDGNLPQAELAATIRRRAGERQATPSRTLSGSLETLELSQMVEALGQAGRTGRLSLVFPDERVGEIYLDQGQVVHVRFGVSLGRAAFTELFALAQWRLGITFDFEVLTREEVFRYPRSVVADVHELLLHTAVDLDELRRRTGHGGGRPG